MTKQEDGRGNHSDPGDEETRLRFVRRAAADPIGRLVKIADLADNCDVSRTARPSERDSQRVARYRRALELIRSLPPG